jgi:uncharacterized protein YkwD
MKRFILIGFGFLFLFIAGCQAGRSGPSPSPTSAAPMSTDTPTRLPVSPTPQELETAALPTPSATSAATQPTATQLSTSPPAPSPTVAAVTQPAPTAAARDGDCIDRATFERDVTIADDTVFQPGEAFVKTWRLYNSGTCPWGEGYSLVFAYGDPMDAVPSSPLPQTDPGARVDVSLDMKAPASAGQHAGNWQLQNAAGQHFGVGMTGNDYFWVQVAVSFAGAEPSGGGAPTESAPPAANTPVASPSGCTSTGNALAEAEILQQINSVRSNYSLAPLNRQGQLDAAAMDYSLDMACNNRVDFTRHTDTRGGRWYERIDAQSYAYSKAFENVYVGNPAFGGTPQTAMNWWMNSTIHRDNILNPDVTEVGIGYAYTDTSDYGGYYTVDFATP